MPKDPQEDYMNGSEFMAFRRVGLLISMKFIAANHLKRLISGESSLGYEIFFNFP